MHVVADCCLRLGNTPCLRGKPRHKAQRHRQDETQRGHDSSEQIDEFIGRHDARVAREPDQRRAERQPCADAVQNRFQRQRVAGRQIAQNRPPLVAERRIHGGGHGKQRQRVPQPESARLFAAERAEAGDRANERNRLTHRVLQKHRAEQHEGKIEKIHQRVAAGKSVVAVHGSPFVKIEPRECAAL